MNALWRKHGITERDYHRVLDTQGFVCLDCERPEPTGGYTFAVYPRDLRTAPAPREKRDRMQLVCIRCHNLRRKKEEIPPE